jgi:lambda family phage portal protein
MGRPNFKSLSFGSRIKESFNLLTGRQKTPHYSIRDYNRIVNYVMKSERHNSGMRLRNSQSGYDAGRTGRVMGDWDATNDMPYTELATYTKKMRARSRDLYRNDATYRSAINTIVQMVVGTGLRPKPKVLDKNGKPDKAINKSIEDAFWKYQRRGEWDARHKMPFVGEGQRLALRTVLVSGDYILNAVSAPGEAYLPVKWQQCEIDRLDDSQDIFIRTETESENVKQTLHGINLDEFGVPVSYRFKGISKAIPAKNVIHSYMVDRPEQYIGAPAAAAALSNLRTKHNIVEDYALKSEAIAKVLWFLSNENTESPGIDDTDSNDVLELDSLSQMRGEKAPEAIKMPDSVNDTIGPLVRLLMDGVCSVLGTSYTTVTRNMDGVNFAASKFIDIQEWRAFTILKDWLIADLCDPFWEKFVLNCVITGKISGLTPTTFLKDPYRYYECAWTGNGKQDVDSLKDISADNEGLKTGIFTLSDVIGKRGEDFDDHIETIRMEREKLIEAGLEDLIFAQSGTTKSATIDPNAPDDSKDGNNNMEKKLKPKSEGKKKHEILV